MRQDWKYKIQDLAGVLRKLCLTLLFLGPNVVGVPVALDARRIYHNLRRRLRVRCCLFVRVQALPLALHGLRRESGCLQIGISFGGGRRLGQIRLRLHVLLRVQFMY